MFYKRNGQIKFKNYISYVSDSELSHFKIKPLIFAGTFVINLTNFFSKQAMYSQKQDTGWMINPGNSGFITMVPGSGEGQNRNLIQLFLLPAGWS